MPAQMPPRLPAARPVAINERRERAPVDMEFSPRAPKPSTADCQDHAPFSRAAAKVQPGCSTMAQGIESRRWHRPAQPVAGELAGLRLVLVARGLERKASGAGAHEQQEAADHRQVLHHAHELAEEGIGRHAPDDRDGRYRWQRGRRG